MPAQYLQALAGAVEALVGERGLEHRRDQRAPALGAGAARGVGVVLADVEFDRGVVGQHARAVDPGALGIEDAAYRRVFGDQVGAICPRRVRLGRAHLPALGGVGVSDLPGGLEQAYTLHADVQARSVHHHEHRIQAAVGLAHQPAAGVVETQHAGGAAVQAHLFLDALAHDRIAGTLRQDFRRQEQRQALGAGQGVRQARQHQVHDVVRQVVFAAGDEDLGAADAVTSIVLRCGACPHQPEVAAGLRLGQAHGGEPFAAGELAQVAGFERVAAMVAQAFVGAVQQARRHGPAMVGRAQPFVQHAFQHAGQALSAVLGSAGQCRPAGLPERLVGVAESRRHGDPAGFEAAAHLVSHRRQWRNHLADEFRRFLQQLACQAGVGIGERRHLPPLCRSTEHLFQDEGRVGRVGLEVHGGRLLATEIRRIFRRTTARVTGHGGVGAQGPAACRRP